MRFPVFDKDFADLAHAMCRAGSYRDLELEATRASEDVRNVVRAAVDAASLATNPGFVGVVQPFLEGLAQASVLDRILLDASATVMPYSATRVNLTLAGIAAGNVDETDPKPIRATAFDSTEPQRFKPVSIVVASAELLRAPGASAAIVAELRRALVTATNETFVDAVSASADTQVSSGTTAANVAADLATAIATLGSGARSRYYLIVGPATAARLALKSASATVGPLAFLDMTPSGGAIQGIVVMVSDSLANEAVLFDAAKLVVADGGLQLDQARDASLQMDNAPDGTSAAFSLFQRNARGIRVERPFSLAFSSDTSSGIVAVRIVGGW